MISYVPVGIRVTPYQHEVQLCIFRKENPDEGYEYIFMKEEFVIQDKNDTVVFELIVDGSLSSARCWIAAHCCTRAKALQRVSSENSSEILPDSYAVGTKKTAFRFEIEPNELVHVGLIVAIWEEDAEKPTFILCDPQVGNGPPRTAFVLI